MWVAIHPKVIQNLGMHPTLLNLVTVCGSQEKAAAYIGVSQRRFWEYLHGKLPIAPARCLKIELKTAGAVTRAMLRPEIFGPLNPTPGKGTGDGHPNSDDAARCGSTCTVSSRAEHGGGG